MVSAFRSSWGDTVSSGWKVPNIWKATPVTEWLGSSGDKFAALFVAQIEGPSGVVTLA